MSHYSAQARKGRILIVDDAMFQRVLIRKILNRRGYAIVGEAKTGVEAVEMYFRLNPNLVTMDIAMPDMDGIDALKQIKARDIGAKIIVISSMRDAADRSKDAGAIAFLAKPIKDIELEKVVKKVLDGPDAPPSTSQVVISPPSAQVTTTPVRSSQLYQSLSNQQQGSRSSLPSSKEKARDETLKRWRLDQERTRREAIKKWMEKLEELEEQWVDGEITDEKFEKKKDRIKKILRDRAEQLSTI